METGKAVADKIIRESQFTFDYVRQNNVLGMQVLNFGGQSEMDPSGVGYALSYITSELDTSSLLGISSTSPIKIWLNNEIIYSSLAEDQRDVKEISYNRFRFADTIKIKLRQGANKFLVKSLSSGSECKTFLRLITPHGDENKLHVFILDGEFQIDETNHWLLIGPFKPTSHQKINQLLAEPFLPEAEIQRYYKYGDKIYSWQIPSSHLLLDLYIAKDNTYQRDSYLEWHYATGAMMWSILALGEATEDTTYKNFVKKYCDFTLDHYDYFKRQYFDLNAYRGSFHRIFRRTMLDDSGAPSLPFATLYKKERDGKYHELVQQMADYVMNKQVRLPDGTYCRPEPEPMTVWADDLFMSVPFLLLVGEVTGSQKYLDEVCRQIKNFYHYLFDQKSGLVNHGWFEEKKKNTTVFWGRANGWMLWALAEALQILPQNHPDYKKIHELFRSHIDGLINFQGESGMWHQVLTHSESYEETSCTAMFTLAIARGVRNGWLDEDYKEYALKAWNALQIKIDTDGTVHGICRGTGIGENLTFYFNRHTFDNDPRGLGAVITASVEIHRLINRVK